MRSKISLIYSSASIFLLAGCSTLGGNEYPSDYHHYEVLKSFRAPAIQDVAGHSYRLTWHAWHKQPGLLRATCSAERCDLELRFTDGYGTYTQGKLAGVRKTSISREEFEVIERAFIEGGFASLDPHLREGDPYMGVNKEAEAGSIPICIHAPSYYLESFDGERHKVVYRYCQPDYADALRIAYPMIDLSARYFPEQTALVSAEWIPEDKNVSRSSAGE